MNQELGIENRELNHKHSTIEMELEMTKLNGCDDSQWLVDKNIKEIKLIACL